MGLLDTSLPWAFGLQEMHDLQIKFKRISGTGTRGHLDQVLSKYRSTDKMASSLPVYEEQFIDLEEKG